MKRQAARFLSAILVIAFFFGLLPVVTIATTYPYGLTSSSVSVGTGSTLATATTQVGFGGRRWYIAGFDGTGINKGANYMALISKTSCGTSAFTTGSQAWNNYSGSTLQSAVNALLPTDSREQGALVGLTLDEVAGTQPTNQKYWALSTAEANAVSQSVRALGDSSWWLRSTGDYGNVRYVMSDGTINTFGMSATGSLFAVRPGAAVDLSKVLFAAGVNAKGSTVGAVSAIDLSSEIKFTILDNTNLGISVSGTSSISVNQGSSISITFSGAQTGTDKYVSCALVSVADNMVKYYAKLSSAASGTVSVPTNSIQPGAYKLLIYNEQVCSGDYSDYASTPATKDLTVVGSTNTAPALRAGVPSTATASVSVGSAYTLNLSTIFYDPEGNDLTYRVYVNGSASAVSAPMNYSFTPSAAGTTTLRFTAYDGALESVSYTVTLTATNVAVTGITVWAENHATKIGQNGQIQLYYSVTPSNATNQAVTWSAVLSGAGYLATGDVDAGNMLRTYNVTSNGTVTITATAKDGSGKTAQLVLSISSNIVTGISVSAATEDLAVGSSVQMSAVVTATTTSTDKSVTWSIPTGSGIASISSAGLLSCTGSGDVTVRATANDGSGICGEKALYIKATQTAPSAPTLSSSTASTVTLNAITGAEYSKDCINWQSSTTFTGLNPYTAYNFYARKVATATLAASPPSSALAVTTNKAVLGGTVTISGTLAYGEELTAVTSALTAEPDCTLSTLSYQWTRGGTGITGATAASYTLTKDDLGKIINVTVTAANCTGSVSSTNAAATAKGDPDYTAPTGLLASYGDTLADVTLPENFTWEAAATTSVGEPGVNSFAVTYTPDDTECYNTVTGISVNITVGKVDPVCSPPSASAITYGQALSNSALTGGSATGAGGAGVSGSFAWTSGTTTPAVSDSGATEYNVTFTPTDTAHYNAVTVKVKLTVNKADTTITTAPTAGEITYGQALSDSALIGGAGSVPGSFSWTSGSTKPTAADSDTTAYSVTFTPTDTANYNTTSMMLRLTVNKATPTITTAPTAEAITYGDALSDSSLTGGSVTGVGDLAITGSFVWTDEETEPAVSDSETTPYSVTFTPTDTINYDTVTTTVTLKVYGAASSVTTAPTASAITYGDSLADSSLLGGAGSVEGTFAWTDSTVKPAVSDSDTTQYAVTFTPTDTNYSPSTTMITVTVNKADTAVTTPPTASAITYGQSLSASGLSDGAGSVPGNFSWTSGSTKPAVADSDTTAYSVTFTPTDSGNYNTSTTTVTLKVNQAPPTITAAPTPSAITYGQALSNSSLSAGSATGADGNALSGSFSWTVGDTTPAVSDSNTTAYSVTFTPTDTGNYNTATTTVTLTVNKADTTITTAPTVGEITYGQALFDSALTGGAGSVPGSFSWTSGSTKPTVADSDTTPYSITFTPTDTANYNTTSMMLRLTVNKATPTITAAPTAEAITYGDALSDSSLTGGSVTGVGGLAITGSFVWTDEETEPAVADNETTLYSVTFTPTDTINYDTVTTTVTLKVYGAASSVTTAPTASAITYGDSLADSSLLGGAGSVEGTFAWTDSTVKPTVSDSDTTQYAVTFTPTDTGNYNTSTTTVTLTVNKADTAVTTPPTASAITYGQSLSASGLSDGAGSVPGNFSWTSGSTKPAVADSDTTAYSVTFTPTDSGNYNTSTTTVTLKVNQAPPTITAAPTPSAITYGQALSNSSLSAGSATGADGNALSGSFSWTVGDTTPAVSDSNTTAYSVTFTPTDTGNYNTATTTVTLTVNKADTTITTAPTVGEITYGQALFDSALTGGAGSVPGSFSWTSGSTKPTVADSDTTPYSITFTPTDTANYNTTSMMLRLTVNKATPTITAAPTAEAITYGDALSDSSLTGGSVTGVGGLAITGSFVWTDEETEPAVADNETTLYSVTFKPTDSVNYSEATTTVTLKVERATPAIVTKPTAGAITYGQALSDSTFSGGSATSAGGAGVSGSFAWTSGTITPAVSDSGTTAYSVTFTPTDTGNYNTSTTTVTLTVNKADTAVTTPPTASAITYGQSLSASGLSDGAGSVPGNFSWTSGSTKPAVADSDTTAYSVTFTPTDSGNYNTSTTTVTLTVNQAPPTITAAPTPSAITYGQALSNSSLSAGSATGADGNALSGSFSWTVGDTTPAVSDSNTTAYSVTFTPTDTGNYNTATTTVTLTVNKADTTITTAPTVGEITYGQALFDSALTGGAGSVPGSFSWTSGSTKPTVADSDTTPYSITFTPTDTANYNTTSMMLRLTVNKATPTITAAPTAEAITYGDALSDSSLTGGSVTGADGNTLSGSFSWADGRIKPAVSDSNTTAYAVTFTPTDTANYNSAAATLKLTVNKATPTITTTPTPSSITYGQALADSVLSGGAATGAGGVSLAGSFSWTDGDINPEVSDSNITAYDVTFTPTDTANYITAAATVTLTVNKAPTSVPAAPSASGIVYGQTLAESVFTGGSGSVPGSFSWTDGTIKPTVADSGVTSFSVTFTPTSGNYAQSTTSVTLTVVKATPVILTKPTASTITLGQPLASSALSGGAADTDGVFTWTDGNIQPTLADSDTTEYTVTFTPSDTANYTTTELTVTVSVIVEDLSDGSALVNINGQGGFQVATTTSKDSDGRTVTQVVLGSVLIPELTRAGKNSEIVILIKDRTDAAMALTGDLVAALGLLNDTLTLKTTYGIYTIPASIIDVGAAARQLGAGDPSEITVTIEMAKPSAKVLAAAADAAEEGGFTIAATPVEFIVTCEYHGRSIELDAFDSYVARYIALPAGADPDQITTAVVILPDGGFYQAPTQIVTIGGVLYAQIMSLTNSVYALVIHTVEFADLANHWAREAINDMGSRMIVGGVGNNRFEPDRNMTRAEFATIMVRALGLAPGAGGCGFSDVAQSAWYCGYIQTAAEYGLITGFTDGTFRPQDVITREQAMTMIARAMRITGLSSGVSSAETASLLGAFPDGGTVSAYAREGVAACLKAGIVSGKSSGLIASGDYVTRAEVAVMVRRLLQESELI